eukprot:6541613-Prymnesium_polylepis.1
MRRAGGRWEAGASWAPAQAVGARWAARRRGAQPPRVRQKQALVHRSFGAGGMLHSKCYVPY